MSEQHEITRAHTGEDIVRDVTDSPSVPETVGEPAPVAVEVVSSTEEATAPAVNGEPVQPEGWQAQAGRKGARRVHQLIQHGRLYEQEHGLKRGRQRLRQLIQLGKLYEQEHGLRTARPKVRRERLSRMGRAELLNTLLQCLLRLAKPSFRAELMRLVESLPQEGSDNAA
jgi:hypothetical protein